VLARNMAPGLLTVTVSSSNSNQERVMARKGMRFGNILDWDARGDLAVRCPACDGQAIFTSPYDYLTGVDADQSAADPRSKGVRYSSGFAIERFPDIFPWRDPNNPYLARLSREIWGVLSCCECVYRRKHLLDWPTDAYYQIDFPFGTLWAYTRAHLVQIRKMLADEWQGPQPRALYRVPKESLIKRNRSKALRGVEKLLLDAN
jgi:hypothetical protein